MSMQERYDQLAALETNDRLVGWIIWAANSFMYIIAKTGARAVARHDNWGGGVYSYTHVYIP
jgi:hypothetical protein